MITQWAFQGQCCFAGVEVVVIVKHGYVVRSTNSPGVVTPSFFLVILVVELFGMLLVRWGKQLLVLPGFLVVYSVHECARPVQAFEVDDLVVGAVRCHRMPSFVKQAPAVQLVRIDFCDGVTYPVRQQDPTVGGIQLVGVPLFLVVALLQPRFERLPHPQLDQTNRRWNCISAVQTRQYSRWN